MNLITAPGIEGGAYFNGLRPAQPNAQAMDRSAREQLRALSRRLTNAP
jgi:hypothetical protein